MNFEKPFWEKTYSENTSPTTFNKGKPSLDVVEVLENFIHHSRVLDLGCGEGRNALYAAGLGYDVTAIDISEAGIAKLKHLAAEKNLTLDAWVQDMRTFQTETRFDVIISHGCLHLIHRHEWPSVITRMKAMTAPGGYNIVGVFTDKIPPSPDMAPFTQGLFREGELFDHYSDWRMLHQSSYTFKDDHGRGIQHHHAANRIIAQKP
jgi:tellurite methyltransferase